MATEAFIIAITSTGTREVQRDLSNIGTTGDKAAKSIDTVGKSAVGTKKSVDALAASFGAMRNILVGLSIIRALSGFAEFASTATQLANKLTTITHSTLEVQAVLQALGETSLRTRTDLETNVDTFVRLARSTGSLKLSYSELIELTRAIADTVHIAGASTAQAKRALMDFAEGLAAGSLQGRQLRAMIMQLPTLGDAIGKSFGLAGAQLMEFLHQHPGALSPEAIIKSLKAALPGLDAMIGKTQVTISQAFVNLHTKALLFMEDFDRIHGISKAVSDVLTYVGDHISAIAKFIAVIAGIGTLNVVIGVLTALLTNMGFLFSVVNFLTGGLLKLGVVLVTLPFTIVTGAINLSIMAFNALRVTVLATMTVFRALWAAAVFIRGAIESVSIILIVLRGAVTAVQSTFIALTSAIALARVALTGFTIVETIVTLMTDVVVAVAGLFTGLVAIIPTIIIFVALLATIGIAAAAAGAAVYGFILPLAQLATLADPLSGLKLSIKDIPGIFEAAFNTIVENFPLITEALKALWHDMVNSMKNEFDDFNGGVARKVTFNLLPDSSYKGGAANALPTNTAAPILEKLRQKFAQHILTDVIGLRGAQDGGKPTTSNVLGGTPNVVIGKDLNKEDDGTKSTAAVAAIQTFLAQFSPYAASLAKIDAFNKLVIKSTKAHVDILGELAKAGIHANSIADARAQLLVLVQREVLGVGNEDMKSRQELDLLDRGYKAHIITMNEYLDALLKVHTAQLAADPTNIALGTKVAVEHNAQGLRNTGETAQSILGTALGFQSSPAMAAIQTKILNDALKDGTITAEGYAHAMIEVLGGQRDLASGETLARLKAQAELLDEGKIAAEALSGVYDKFNADSKFLVQMRAINDAMRENPALIGEGVKAIRDLQISLLSTKEDALSGFQRGMLEAQKSMNDFAATASTAVTQAFNDLTDALTNFFSTGKFDINKLGQDLLQNLDKLAVQQVFTGPLSNMLGFDQQGQGGIAGSGGILSQIFGGLGLGGVGAGQLGTVSNPMYVQFAPGVLGAAGGLPGGAGGGGGSDLFSNGGLFSSSGFFHNLFNGGGGAGSTSSGILGVLGDIGGFLGFAGGGDMVVGGQGGTDSQRINFKATPGEIISVRRPGDANDQEGGGPPTVVHMHVHGVSDVDGFNRSQGQIAASLASQLSRAHQRNGN